MCGSSVEVLQSYNNANKSSTVCELTLNWWIFVFFLATKYKREFTFTKQRKNKNWGSINTYYVQNIVKIVVIKSCEKVERKKKNL